ncbi:dTMP kinase [Apostasia shenzhenica]|uniref:dTMP kinase n=1 Tax=Apostasia shenzhenica TaxID=1088818 RepID=A0A2I0ASE2_9ASPA|nr:dTMP kinase [Apostasia shenzhenica]
MALLISRHFPLHFSSSFAAAARRRSIDSLRIVSMAESSKAGHRYTNRLASEQSPYLLQHAHNPVDREERPDVDKVYMTYVQALYGGGGWPLSVFLSPDLKPLMGGTYFPPDDNYGRPGFKTVLRKVKEAWESKREMLENGGTLAMEQLSKALSATARSLKLPDDVTQDSVKLCSEQLSRRYDPKFGGFGSAPKFPRPVELCLLLYESKKLREKGRESESNKDIDMVLHTLQCMARGGVHDHVGGGFHRYSVDECWHVPHFEKMLYDQGQLANVYLDAFTITKDVFYASVARDILDYVKRDMTGDDGQIFSAEDADSAETEDVSIKKEGAFYVWTSDEVDEVLGDQTELFKVHYYIKASGNCDLSRLSDPHHEFRGKNALFEKKDLSFRSSKLGMSIDNYAHILGLCRKKVFDARCLRPRPHLDDKVIVSWNGLAISSFARASKILKAESKETKYHFPVVGCNICMNVVAKLNGWLGQLNCKPLRQDEVFLDKEGGGYFNTPGDDPYVLLRVKEDYDGAEPSGNSVSAINLIRLSSMLTGELSKYYRQNAEHLLVVFENLLKEQSIAVPLMCCAADMLVVPSWRQVVIVGDKMSMEFNEMVATVHASYDPSTTVIQIDPRNREDMEFWENHNENIFQMAKSSAANKAAVSHRDSERSERGSGAEQSEAASERSRKGVGEERSGATPEGRLSGAAPERRIEDSKFLGFSVSTFLSF